MLGFQGVGLHGWFELLVLMEVTMVRNIEKSRGNIFHFHFSTLNTMSFSFSVFRLN